MHSDPPAAEKPRRVWDLPAALDPLMILECSTDSVLVVDCDWRIRYLNPRAVAQIAFGRELLGADFWQSFPEIVGSDFGRAYRRTMAESIATQTEAFYAPFGRWFAATAYPLPEGLVVFFRDTTAQKQSEAALRASQDHLARAQRIVAVGSAEVNFRTGAWTWSDETYRIYGMDKGTVTPSMDLLMQVVHEDDREAFKSAIDDAWKGIAPPPLEYRVIRPDGQTRTIHREAEILHDEHGVAIGVIGTKRDVTELRAAERHKEELRQRLLHAQRLEALGTLAGGIAHDLNNTLVPVLGITKMIYQAQPEGAKEREQLELILEGAERAKELVKQILTFSRAEHPEKRPTDLAALLRSTLKLLRASVPSTIKFIDRIVDVPLVSADPSQLHQVILNLVTNAAQAIGNRLGCITITLSPARMELEADGLSGPVALLTVSDTGHGMDKATSERIFEPFFTTKDVGTGTGLGLSVVHGVIIGHGGRIKVASQIGLGTRFEVYLPTLAAESQKREDLK